MNKVSIATGSLQFRYGDKEALRIAKERGADAVDFTLEDFKDRFDYRNKNSVYSLPDDQIVAYYADLKEYADKIGLEICQTHGRGIGFLNKKEEDDALVRNARIDCLVTATLGAPYCVMHPVSTMWHRETPPEVMRDLNFEQFTRILPFAKQYGIKIAAETFGDIHGGEACDFFGNIDEFIDSYERICAVEDFRDYFVVCVDTGHSNKATKFNNPQVPEVIRRLGGRIKCLHINDNNTETDQHLIPYVKTNTWKIKGTIDWDETFKALQEVGYDGVYNLEVVLSRYGEEIMPDFVEFAVKVMRNALSKL